MEKRYTWLDSVKAFAILAILYNHLVEKTGVTAWFTYPSYNWPSLGWRLENILPAGENAFFSFVKFAGLLGDSGAGVFILVSGFALTLSSLKKKKTRISFQSFFRERLWRIFPLYLLIHVLVNFLAIYVHEPFDPFSISNFLSLLGLRFTDRLFFYLSPSWWFIWLILQLYLVFPLIYNFLQKRGIFIFLMGILFFTFLSRGAGLLGVTWNSSLYYWSMGLFFGTRLAEFGLGMALAKMFHEKNFLVHLEENRPRYSWYSLGIYFIGLVFSFFYLTTLASNLFVTLGLFGIFFFLSTFLEKYDLITKSLSWIGKYSFGIFLLHHPFILWSEQYLPFNSLLSSIIGMVISIFLAVFLQYLVSKIQWLQQNLIRKVTPGKPFSSINRFLTLFTISYIVFFMLGTIFIKNFMPGKYQQLFFLSLVILVAPIELIFMKISSFLRLVRMVAITLSVLFLFVFTEKWVPVFPLFFLTTILLAAFAYWISRKHEISLAIGLIFSFILVGALEQYLSKKYPLEAGEWGEFPALEKDPLTTYNLKPNFNGILHYNNYKYRLKTNSHGLVSPGNSYSFKDTGEFRILVVGDAFTMPEGVEYQFSYTHLLSRELEKKPGLYRVINAGVTGFGPLEILGQIKKHLPLIQPDLVIWQFFINEFEEINVSKEERLKSIGLIHKESKVKDLLDRSQFAEHVNRLKIKSTKKERDIYNYNKSLAYFYDKSANVYDEETILKLKECISSIKKSVKKFDANLLILFVPGQLAVSSPEHIDYYPHHLDISSPRFDFELPNRIFNLVAYEKEISYIDLTDTLKQHPVQPVYFPESWHWNKEGHQVVANFIMKNPIFKKELPGNESPK